MNARQLWHLTVRGLVQGVGFRPFVYRLAASLGLSGSVANTSLGVAIDAEGDEQSLHAFAQRLRSEAPPFALIEALDILVGEPRGRGKFEVLESLSVGGIASPIPADLAVCDDCLAELFDPSDRRYLYPFLNCTKCGPRFTLIRGLPYDRAATTMATFAMCTACGAEYRDPANRRFHAQPNACAGCGPRLWLELRAGKRVEQVQAAIEAVQEALRAGSIAAIRGVGGFHLACDATNQDAVALLRSRKQRGDKPFAVMVRDVESALEVAHLDEEERAVLCSVARPIVLLRKRAGGRLAEGVAPGNGYVGVLLPYSPLHHLLLEDRPLVMTSGNVSDEPIASTNQEARQRLQGMADLFLLHDREIHIACDDSVVRVWAGHTLPVRRSRGYAPFPVALASDGPCVLAAGGELKAAFCVANGHRAYMSQHVGDMEYLPTLEWMSRSVEHFQKLFGFVVTRVACDAHPGYLSSGWAKSYAAREGVECVTVQHHHAHVASLTAESGLDREARVIGVAFDGTGYGDDGAMWGGEVLLASQERYERFAHLAYVPLPGGDAATSRPYRAALAHLWAAGIDWSDDVPAVAACADAERALLRQQLDKSVNAPRTSSMGRLLDAAASLIGVRQTAGYEGQAAIEMEALAAAAGEHSDWGMECWEVRDGPPDTVSAAPLWHRLIAARRAGASASRLALGVHQAVAALTVRLCLLAREQSGLDTVGLTGGVYQNVVLLGLTVPALQAHGLRVLVHQRVPANDGGLSLGQAVIARCG